MPLEPLLLDDMTWASIVARLRDRIAASSSGEWTHHAPVDAGVTLIELHAWLLEQRLFWLDQTPDSLLRGALALLGVSPKPVRSARTVLHVRPSPDSAPPAIEVLPEGALFRVHGSEPAIIFRLANAVAVHPILELQILSGDEDLSAELQSGRWPEIFATPGQDLLLRIRTSAPFTSAPPNARLSMLIELETVGPIPSEWLHASVTGVPPPVSLQFARNTASGFTPFPLPGVEDGTGGFRRSGILSLPLPADWLADGPPSADGSRWYSLRVSIESGAFTYPPRVRQITPNAVTLEHARPAAHELTREWLPLPGRTISLHDLITPGLGFDSPALPQSIRLSLFELFDGWQDWSLAPDLSFHPPESRAFEFDRGRGEVRFGDGLTGRQPVLGAADPNVRLSFDVGGGIEGNVGARSEWRAVDRPEISAFNPVAASGGAEAEPLSAARARAAAQMRAVERAVTVQDCEYLAVTTPGVAIERAHAAVGFHPEFPCFSYPGALTLFIVPGAPRDSQFDDRKFTWIDAPLPDRGAIQAVRSRLENAKLIGTELFIEAPRYRGVDLRLLVRTSLQAPANQLRQQLHEALRLFLDPLRGGADGTGWEFGASIIPSAIQRAAEAALGTGSAIAFVEVTLDGSGLWSSCQPVDIADHELVYLRSLDIRFELQPAGRGGFR